MKIRLAASLMALFCTGCDARPTEASTLVDPPQAPAVVAENQAAIEDDERITEATMRGYGALVLRDNSFAPKLADFQRWAGTASDGTFRAATAEERIGTVVMMAITWSRDNGQLADYGFVFAPDGQGGARLAAVYEGEERLSAKDSEETVSGIVLDMYHQGIVPASVQ